MTENPNWIAWDQEAEEEDTDRDVEVNGAVPGGGSGSGAPTDASYVTTSDEPDLDAETQHANLSGADLHDPAQHDHQGDTINPDEVQVGGNTALLAVAASGSVTLSSGVGTVDTGLSDAQATFLLGLGVDDPNADTKITGRLFWNDSAGTYHVEIVEDETSVGNPTVNYDIIRVR